MRGTSHLLISHLLIFLTAAAVAGWRGSAKSVDEIAARLRQAVRQTDGAPQLESGAEQTAQRAQRVVCDALGLAGSKGVEYLVKQLKREAALAKIEADRLVAAADAIDSAQKAAEVAEKICQ